MEDNRRKEEMGLQCKSSKQHENQQQPESGLEQEKKARQEKRLLQEQMPEQEKKARQQEKKMQQQEKKAQQQEKKMQQQEKKMQQQEKNVQQERKTEQKDSLHQGKEAQQEKNVQQENESGDRTELCAQPPGVWAGQMDHAQDCSAYMQEPAQKAGFFRTLGSASQVYALVYTICMFQNTSGITMPIWIAATIVYACTVMKSPLMQQTSAMGRLKRGSRCYICMMLLFGIATCLTDNHFIIAGNYIGFFILLLLFLLHNFYDDSRWGFTKSLAEMMTAVFGACGCMLTPFTDGSAYYQEKRLRKNKTLRAVFIGVLCAVPGIIVLGACLVSADAVFDTMVSRMVSGIHVSMNMVRMILLLLFGFFSSYCGMRFLSMHSQRESQAEQVKLEPVIAMTFTGLITIMYLIFCTIQVVYLFAGSRQLPAGISYAEYARRGFFQLLFVCMANLVLVLSVKKFFNKHKILDALLLLVCACTLLMTASSAYRMLLYIGAYQLTFLRVLVLAALAVLALFTAGAAAVILKPEFPLFGYFTVVAGAVYLIFAFSHVDYFIAAYNLSYAAENDREIDWQYLSGLSMDAAPAVFAYQEQACGEQKEQLRKSAERAKKRAEQGGAQGYLVYGERIPYEGLDGNMDTGIDGHADANEAYGVGRSGDLADENDMIYEDYEEFYRYQWYGMFVYNVYEAQKNMGLRNFNVSRYLAVKYLPDV